MGTEIIMDSSRGVLTSAQVPKEIVDILIDGFTKAAQSQTFIDNMKKQGLTVAITAGDDYMAMMKQSEADIVALKPLLGWK